MAQISAKIEHCTTRVVSNHFFPVSLDGAPCLLCSYGNDFAFLSLGRCHTWRQGSRDETVSISPMHLFSDEMVFCPWGGGTAVPPWGQCKVLGLPGGLEEIRTWERRETGSGYRVKISERCVCETQQLYSD